MTEMYFIISFICFQVTIIILLTLIFIELKEGNRRGREVFNNWKKGVEDAKQIH